MIEQEMNSVVMQKDFLSKDFHSLQEEHEALKAAYHSLSYESATGKSSNSKNSPSSEETEKLAKEVLSLKECIQQKDAQINRLLQNQEQNLLLKENSSTQYEAYTKELEEKVATLTKDKENLTFQFTNSALECKQYKQLTEKLKQKIKDLSNQVGGGNGKDKDFLDTFEEVMQEEMLTMKIAFEAKLKAAKDESDALSKKHQQEIARLHVSASPFNSATKR
jgi:polyribonucleotide nucleotidyltransferase